MGLIKTAIMTGGGMYAASKIAKSIQQQNPTRNQNSSRDSTYPEQDNYYTRPAPSQGPQHPRAARDETYGDSPADRDPRAYDPNRDYSARPGMRPAKSNGFTFPADNDDNYSGRYIQQAEYPYQPASYSAPRYDNPPTYSPHPQYAQPRPYAAQQGQQTHGGSSSLSDVAAGMAMDFVRNGGKDGKKDKGKKGTDMISELFK